mmetsp:Transcript_37930/g.122048  ORF Transcript_37930/g.122048 Transcript_37930/m.122048 type:complete len:203 (+) Transcript_37930:178-786(+)
MRGEDCQSDKLHLQHEFELKSGIPHCRLTAVGSLETRGGTLNVLEVEVLGVGGTDLDHRARLFHHMLLDEPALLISEAECVSDISLLHPPHSCWDAANLLLPAPSIDPEGLQRAGATADVDERGPHARRSGAPGAIQSSVQSVDRRKLRRGELEHEATDVPSPPPRVSRRWQHRRAPGQRPIEHDLRRRTVVRLCDGIDVWV